MTYNIPMKKYTLYLDKSECDTALKKYKTKHGGVSLSALLRWLLKRFKVEK